TEPTNLDEMLDVSDEVSRDRLVGRRKKHAHHEYTHDTATVGQCTDQLVRGAAWIVKYRPAGTVRDDEGGAGAPRDFERGLFGGVRYIGDHPKAIELRQSFDPDGCEAAGCGLEIGCGPLVGVIVCNL